MKNELSPILDRLTKDYLNLRHTWEEFNQLFSGDLKNIELMNSIAPGFFALMQGMMIESMILGMARMTDRARTSSHDNLSLFHVVCAPYAELDDYRAELRLLVEAARVSTLNARHWRDKRIAHRDLMQHEAAFTIGYNELRDGIKSIYIVLNRITELAQNTSIAEDIIPSAGNATSLLAALYHFANSRPSNEIETEGPS